MASKLVTRYCAATPGSQRLAEQAEEYFPGGVTQDSRRFEPYNVYFERAQGPYKWDVDGRRYIDYVCGNGALLLGHRHPQVTTAVEEQLKNGSHFAGNHPLEVQWARAVRELVPSAERIRFTASGSEASMLAFRLARAFTNRTKIIRFTGHFHGWQDHATSGIINHFDGTPTPGVLPGILENLVFLEANDVPALRAALAKGDIAAVIVEPTGGGFGKLPLAPGFLRALRDATAEHGTVLIFDEVVTGFRVARGGAQAHFGITPDLTLLAKVLGGGLPGAAVCGRQEILDLMDWDAHRPRISEKIPHQGTFNANPLSAAAGIATLGIVATTDACRQVNRFAAELRAQLNETLEQDGVDWAVYGEFSDFQFFLNPEHRPIKPTAFDPLSAKWDELNWNPAPLTKKLRMAMLLNGIDMTNRPGGLVSTAHTAQDLAATVDALRASIATLRQDGDLPARTSAKPLAHAASPKH